MALPNDTTARLVQEVIPSHSSTSVRSTLCCCVKSGAGATFVSVARCCWMARPARLVMAPQGPAERKTGLEPAARPSQTLRVRDGGLDLLRRAA
jgi:hypothetical protein